MNRSGLNRSLEKTPTILAAILSIMGVVACGGSEPTTNDPEGMGPAGNGPNGSAGTAPMGSGGSGNPGGNGSSGTPGTVANGGQLNVAGSNGAGGTDPGAGGTATDPSLANGDPTLSNGIVPLFSADTVLEPEIHYETADAIVTKWGDRGRDRHGREDNFQSYDHFLPHYWEHRTARYILTDHVAKGGNTIEVSWVTEWELDQLPEFRAWYYGMGSVAHYTGNYAPGFEKEGPGTYDNDHVKISDSGDQYKYTYTIRESFDIDGQSHPLAVGQFMEIEASQFLSNPPVGRDNYYGTMFLYEVGNGGMVPFYNVGDFDDKASERENSHKLDEMAWLGGRTTLPYQFSDEPDNNFLQMATNLSPVNAQPFVRGRRVHHTNMDDGSHDESAENEPFTEIANIAGPNYVNNSCDSCHHRNGRAPVAAIGENLDKWVFKVAAADGTKDPMIGGVLQPQGASGAAGEGTVSIAQWTEADGLRSPTYQFTGAQPALFSARLAPQLVGMGLLEAVAETTILGFEDVNDEDGDGVSGKAQISADPVSGVKRLGRFGWKAGASSVTHQIAGALNTDMGVMTSVLPLPDCGDAQTDCGNEAGMELPDEQLTDLVKYVSLLGIRARRSIDDSQALNGEAIFGDIGCASCHVTEMMTSPYHPLAELRNQLIHPYSDLLLHDMGAGLADNLGEREATGAEWRTTPLWGIGLSPCVTGGQVGPFQHDVCEPNASYLHDGRARTLDEAIRWHGGEGQASNDAYMALSAEDKAALIKFLETL
jgi:CxxC motif-containing protein (DUF1111 family)